MKIYTKTGDKGETGLFGGKRVKKSSERINAYGTIDELNSFIGLVRDLTDNNTRKEELKQIQNELFVAGAFLASDPEKPNAFATDLSLESIVALEKSIDAMESVLTPLKNFILPGGHPAVSYCHIARTVCRRAERAVVSLRENEFAGENIIPYLNRLSDYLFVLARFIAKELNVEEVTWRGRQ
ncbi:MAG TPA: cob(I)yrinic acid a,c-diamide adenosyltransferase [Cytophagaceae bacterium]